MSPSEQKFLEEKFASLNQRMDVQDVTLGRLDYAINGNGKPGLKTMVDRHEQTIKFVKNISWKVGTPILAAFGAGIVAAAVYLFHHI